MKGCLVDRLYVLRLHHHYLRHAENHEKINASQSNSSRVRATGRAVWPSPIGKNKLIVAIRPLTPLARDPLKGTHWIRIHLFFYDCCVFVHPLIRLSDFVCKQSQAELPRSNG